MSGADFNIFVPAFDYYHFYHSAASQPTPIKSRLYLLTKSQDTAVWYCITHKIVLMRVTFRYLEVIPAFIYVAENSLHRKHYDHVQFAKLKVKRKLHGDIRKF